MGNTAKPLRHTGGEKPAGKSIPLPALANLTEAEKKSRLLQWANIRHFVPDEFDSPDQPGSGILMNIEFIMVLDAIRHDCGFAFVVKPPSGSGFRTPGHNKKVGGVSNGAHTKAVAVDTRCLDAEQRFKIVTAAIKHGVKRIGIGENFIHLDMDYSLPQGVMWLYTVKAKANSKT